MGGNWADLTPDEKRAKRFEQWLQPAIQFPSESVAVGYRKRVQRLIDVIELRIPDRVPCILPTGFFPAWYAGTSLKKVIYDYTELRRAWFKFIHEFDMDTYSSPGTVLAGRVFENLGFRQYRWPGYGLGDDVSSYQYIEAEYMRADEYDLLIADPSDYWMRVYLPRIFGALEPLAKLPSFTSIVEIPSNYFGLYSRPDIKEALLALLEAGEETARWNEVLRDCGIEASKAGFPSFRDGIAKAPFDIIGDTLRGTQGIIMDMFRQPDKLLEALERITPLTVRSAVYAINASGGRVVFMPLHKGDDAFMSDKQFETFYWPTLLKVVLGLIDEGIVPFLFAEGRYNNRLEAIAELPRGRVVWQFDQTDMVQAKKVLGDRACIAGNVPTSLLVTGTPQAVKDYCRGLIEACGKGGGFILTGGANLDRGKAENLRAMMEAVKEYGIME